MARCHLPFKSASSTPRHRAPGSKQEGGGGPLNQRCGCTSLAPKTEDARPLPGTPAERRQQQPEDAAAAARVAGTGPLWRSGGPGRPPRAALSAQKARPRPHASARKWEGHGRGHGWCGGQTSGSQIWGAECHPPILWFLTDPPQLEVRKPPPETVAVHPPGGPAPPGAGRTRAAGTPSVRELPDGAPFGALSQARVTKPSGKGSRSPLGPRPSAF